MSRVADGATTRRERILDMLRYIRTWMPGGVAESHICTYMSLAHGLTRKRTLEYIYEMQLAGVLEIVAGKVKMDIPQFNRLMELLGRGLDVKEKSEKP